MEAHDIVKQVLEAFSGVAGKLSKITGKVEEWYRSHGREPKTHNPSQSGNVSPVTHYLQYVRQYQAAERGAGRMLNRRVYEELEMEMAENDCKKLTQKDLHAGVLKESFDVLSCLNECDFEQLSLVELAAMEEEGAQLRDAASSYVSHIRAIRRIKESERSK